MYYEYKKTKVYYEIIGSGNIPIVFLHGWGGSVDSFKFVLSGLKFSYKAVLIDFPPFGKSGEVICNFNIFDYSNIVKNILQINDIKKPIIVGHSFGGRVAILLASENLARSLILTSSAGMKPKRTVKYHYRVLKHKILKRLKIKHNSGSADYLALKPNMKKTFSNIVSTFLEKYAINIDVPTILFWGEKDKDTPFYMAKRLKKLIKDCEIISFKNCGHFCYLEKREVFIAVINKMAE